VDCLTKDQGWLLPLDKSNCKNIEHSSFMDEFNKVVPVLIPIALNDYNISNLDAQFDVQGPIFYFNLTHIDIRGVSVQNSSTELRNNTIEETILRKPLDD
jgi:hypothetical protein